MENIVLGLGHINGEINLTRDCVTSFYTHSHMYNEMLFYEPFDGYVTVDNEKIPIDTGTLLLITTTNFHSTTMYSQKSVKYLKIAFRDDFTGSAFQSKLTQPILLKDYQSDPYIIELKKRCEESADCPEKLAILLNAILLELTEKGTKLSSPEKKGTELLALRALQTINEKFSEELTLEIVAKYLHVTPQYLSNVFSEYIGVTFSSYLRDKRLKYAASLLTEQNYSVTEVCYLCGFGNLSHFIRCFKKKYGVSPKNFRNGR